jgi:hypothetical protein
MSQGASKGGLIFLVLLTYIFFLLMTPIVFNLTGKLFKMELYMTAILLILSIIFLFGIARPWKAMFFFYILCMINMCGIYTRTWLLTPLILPGIFALVGLYASAISLKDDEGDFEYSEEDTEPVEPYYEGQEIKAAPKKAPAKKPAKKKPARKKKK